MRLLLLIVVTLWLGALHAQENQIDIARIELMPNEPSPYIMRDWKRVAQGYDSLAYDITKTGLYLPLVFVRSSGVNYPERASYGLDTYVGTFSNDNGEAINVYKFRSMRVCEDKGAIVQAQRNDPRVTPFGAFLRRTSLDELPQLFNVFSGSMSLVGPRPHAVAHNEEYRRLIEGYMLRHKVRPGITGWAQVNGLRGETDTVDKMQRRVEYDLDYLRNWSLGLDLTILFRTATLVWRDRNAY